MDKDEILERLNQVFRDIFDDETLMISEQTAADDIDDWDSLAQISLIAAVENEFGIRFDMKTALRLKTVGEMIIQINGLLP